MNHVYVSINGSEVARFCAVTRVEAFKVWPDDPNCGKFGHHVYGTYDDSGREKYLGGISAQCDWRMS